MFDSGKTVVIANPAAGHGLVGRRWTALGDELRRHLGPVALRLTESGGHTSVIAREAVRDGARTIVSVGGDGTHSAIVDGVMQCREHASVALGVLHAGTGGDFRRMVEGAGELERGCARIRTGDRVPVDVGWVRYVTDSGVRESRHFLNICSMGMSGLVDRFVGASNSRRGGRWKYFWATLRAQLRYRPARVRVRIDGEGCGQYDVSVICVCNGRWAGGGMMFAPTARVSDGRFDIVVVEATSLVRGLPVMAGLYNGTHVGSPLVKVFQGKHVEVEVDENVAYMDIDGEAPGVGPAEFRLQESALQVIGVRPEFR